VNGPRLLYEHQLFTFVNNDEFILTVVYACVSLSKVTEQDSYIEDDIEVIVVKISIIMGVDEAVGAIE
jgi:hypothetical protein